MCVQRCTSMWKYICMYTDVHVHAYMYDTPLPALQGWEVDRESIHFTAISWFTIYNFGVYYYFIQITHTHTHITHHSTIHSFIKKDGGFRYSAVLRRQTGRCVRDTTETGSALSTRWEQQRGSRVGHGLRWKQKSAARAQVKRAETGSVVGPQCWDCGTL